MSLPATGINNTNVLIGHFGVPTSLARVYSTIARVFCLHSFTGRYSIQKNKQLWVKAIHRHAFTNLHAPTLSSASRGAEDGSRRKQDALPHSTATNDRPSVKAVKAKKQADSVVMRTHVRARAKTSGLSLSPLNIYL